LVIYLVKTLPPFTSEATSNLSYNHTHSFSNLLVLSSLETPVERTLCHDVMMIIGRRLTVPAAKTHHPTNLTKTSMKMNIQVRIAESLHTETVLQVNLPGNLNGLPTRACIPKTLIFTMSANPDTYHLASTLNAPAATDLSTMGTKKRGLKSASCITNASPKPDGFDIFRNMPTLHVRFGIARREERTLEPPRGSCSIGRISIRTSAGSGRQRAIGTIRRW